MITYFTLFWQVLGLLKKAFDAGLIFTIGQANKVTWGDIKHETDPFG